LYDKIAKWILDGRLPKDLSDTSRLAYGKVTYRRKGQMFDGDAVILLAVLVERKYIPSLSYYDFSLRAPAFERQRSGWECQIWDKPQTVYAHSNGTPTVAEAIITALLALIDKDAESI